MKSSTKKDVGISKHNLPCSESENDKNQHTGVYIGSMGKPSIEDILLYRKKLQTSQTPLEAKGSEQRIGSGSRSFLDSQDRIGI